MVPKRNFSQSEKLRLVESTVSPVYYRRIAHLKSTLPAAGCGGCRLQHSCCCCCCQCVGVESWTDCVLRLRSEKHPARKPVSIPSLSFGPSVRPRIAFFICSLLTVLPHPSVTLPWLHFRWILHEMETSLWCMEGEREGTPPSPQIIGGGNAVSQITSGQEGTAI